MSKINNKIILLSSILVFVFELSLTLPIYAYNGYYSEPNNQNNPKPSISSIEPSSINNKINNKITITINGSGFIPNSVVRKNSSNINSNFIDSNHLMVDIYPNDIYNQDKFFLTVFNGEPGGGYSNASIFTIKNNTAITTTNNTDTINNNTNTINTNTTETNNTVSTNNTKENFNGLTANALLGSNSFMPNGLAQWIFFVIMVIAIIFLWRYVHRSEEVYMSEPMKHA